MLLMRDSNTHLCFSGRAAARAQFCFFFSFYFSPLLYIHSSIFFHLSGCGSSQTSDVPSSLLYGLLWQRLVSHITSPPHPEVSQWVWLSVKPQPQRTDMSWSPLVVINNNTSIITWDHLLRDFRSVKASWFYLLWFRIKLWSWSYLVHFGLL